MNLRNRSWRCVLKLLKNTDKFDNSDYPENTPWLTRQKKGWMENTETLQRTKANIRVASSKSRVTFQQFSIECRFNLVLFTVPCDWCKKLDPTSQPSKASRELVTRVFPRFRQFSCFYFAVLLAACDTCLSFDWLLWWLWLSSTTLIASLPLWEFVDNKSQKVVRM